MEDNSDARETLALLLQARGYRTEEAENGQEALEKLRQGERPCMVVTDLRMPVMDGWELRDEMRRDDELADLPVVVVSASPARETDADRLDAVAYLQKPIDVKQLLRVLDRFC